MAKRVKPDMPKIAYIKKNFRASSIMIIEKAEEILNNYSAQGYVLTLRQLYYQFVARDYIENSQRSYDRLGVLINKARLAGWLDWSHIEDRTRGLDGIQHWDSPSALAESAVAAYHNDLWKDQQTIIEVWVEKDALVNVVERACNPLDVNYLSCRGYMSQSEMWVASIRFARYFDEGKDVRILHIGDHDPSGVDMTRDIQDRLNMFTRALVGRVDVDRIALNMDQIEEYSPPPNFAKMSDTRSGDYIATYGRSAWELDALEPSVIEELITNEIKKYRDVERYMKLHTKQESDRAEIRRAVKPLMELK